MYTSDKRMLQFLEICKAQGIIRFDKEFCDHIEISKQRLQQIKNSDKDKKQNSHFTAKQIENCRRNLNANLDFIFGFSDIPFLKNTKNAQKP